MSNAAELSTSESIEKGPIPVLTEGTIEEKAPGTPKLGDVVKETESGKFVVVGFREDGTPKLRHQVKARFQKGKSGNPLGGKLHGMARVASHIQRESKQGKELVTFALEVIRGVIPRCTVRDRLTALQWLSDRGFGKAADKIEISGPNGSPIVTATASLDLYAELSELRRCLDAQLVGTSRGALPANLEATGALQPADTDEEAGCVSGASKP